jgi:hypothetical protein
MKNKALVLITRLILCWRRSSLLLYFFPISFTLTMLYIANSSRIVVLAFVLYLFYSSTFHVYFDDFEARLLLLLIPTIETT